MLIIQDKCMTFEEIEVDKLYKIDVASMSSNFLLFTYYKDNTIIEYYLLTFRSNGDVIIVQEDTTKDDWEDRGLTYRYAFPFPGYHEFISGLFRAK